MTHIEKQAKAHEHVSRPDYSPKDQVVESDLTLNKTTGLGTAVVLKPDLGIALSALRTLKSINTPHRSANTPSNLLNRLLSRGVTR